MNALAISSLVDIHPAAITGIFFRSRLSKKIRTAGTVLHNLLFSLFTASKLPAHKCPHALEGSSNTIASGAFQYFSFQ
ncbi:hypothetical protein KKH82_07535 [Patescibacteria group bacterium]|nr:hypothetical protein [Patescibacteria group bacterium]